LTICEIVKEVGISCSSCQTILTICLETRHVSAKFVSCSLAQEQKENSLSLASDFLECTETDKPS